MRRRGARWLRTALLCVGLATALAGCGARGTTASGPTTSSPTTSRARSLGTAAPPTVLCGTTIADGAAGVPVVDALRAGTVRFPWELSVGEEVVIRVTAGCPVDRDVGVTTLGPSDVAPGPEGLGPPLVLVRFATLVTHGSRPLSETIAVLVRARARGIGWLVVRRAGGPTTDVRMAVTR